MCKLKRSQIIDGGKDLADLIGVAVERYEAVTQCLSTNTDAAVVK